MTNKRIKELADYFYSSNSSSDVVFRLSLSFGMGGCDMSYSQFVNLMEILSRSDNFIDDLNVFATRIDE